MTFRNSERTSEITTSTGTGPVTLAGGEPEFRDFAATYADGDQGRHCIEVTDAFYKPTGAWEITEGTLTAGILTRTTLIASSTGALLDLAAGPKRVFTVERPLAIGSDVQAHDAKLDALAAVTGAADKLPYFTGLLTIALTTLTAVGRSLIGAADDVAARAALGVNARIFGTGWIEAPTANSEILVSFPSDVAGSILANLSDWHFTRSGLPSADYVLSITRGGTQIGTFTISSAGVITRATTDGLAQAVAEDDDVRILAPADAATVGIGFSFSLLGRVIY